LFVKVDNVLKDFLVLMEGPLVVHAGLVHTPLSMVKVRAYHVYLVILELLSELLFVVLVKMDFIQVLLI